MRLTPKNWAEFQHYKDRSPSWIKLHKRLLDDYDFHCLPVASKALAQFLWLLASEYEDGVIDAPPRAIAFRLHMTEGELIEALNPLVEAKFFDLEQDASEPLADCKRDASLEKRRDREEKTREGQKDFEVWYQTYPKHEAKGSAEKAYLTARKSTDAETLLNGANRARQKYAESDPKFIPLPATWLNQKRWLDDPPAPQTVRSEAAARLYKEGIV